MPWKFSIWRDIAFTDLGIKKTFIFVFIWTVKLSLIKNKVYSNPFTIFETGMSCGQELGAKSGWQMAQHSAILPFNSAIISASFPLATFFLFGESSVSVPKFVSRIASTSSNRVSALWLSGCHCGVAVIEQNLRYDFIVNEGPLSTFIGLFKFLVYKKT